MDKMDMRLDRIEVDIRDIKDNIGSIFSSLGNHENRILAIEDNLN
jgi:hypothetical protein